MYLKSSLPAFQPYTYLWYIDEQQKKTKNSIRVFACVWYTLFIRESWTCSANRPVADYLFFLLSFSNLIACFAHRWITARIKAREKERETTVTRTKSNQIYKNVLYLFFECSHYYYIMRKKRTPPIACMEWQARKKNLYLWIRYENNNVSLCFNRILFWTKCMPY